LITSFRENDDASTKIANGKRLISRGDVRAALEFAHRSGLPVAARGGGHNVAGNAVCEGGLVIDLSGWKGIGVDPEARTARAEPGVLLGQFDRATQAFGLATPTGNVSMTGLAGLTLGGGLGWIARKHGPTCDNLVAADVVTVDGTVVRASETENPDLLWGLRGGGGNFGVVTAFEYRLHPVGPRLLAGAVVHPFTPDVLRFFADYAATAPDALSVMASTFRAAPAAAFLPSVHGQLFTALAVCYAGPLDEGERLLAPLRAFGSPLVDSIAPMAYTALQSGSDGAFPIGQLNYWKSHYLGALPDAALDLVTEHASRMRSPLSSFYFQHLGGAIARGGDDTAAFGHRDGTFDFTILGVWHDPADNDAYIAWARGFAAAMQPFSTGVYVNNLGSEGSDRVRDAYRPATYTRLVGLKDRYDPSNALRFNQNIQPSSG
jgi:FAD/FMN-containing dehydrogenase